MLHGGESQLVTKEISQGHIQACRFGELIAVNVKKWRHVFGLAQQMQSHADFIAMQIILTVVSDSWYHSDHPLV